MSRGHIVHSSIAIQIGMYSQDDYTSQGVFFKFNSVYKKYCQYFFCYVHYYIMKACSIINAIILITHHNISIFLCMFD